MVDLAEALRDMKAPRKVAPQKKNFAPKRLKRMALWGATAGAALFAAVMASGTEMASERLNAILHHGGGPAAAPPPAPVFDAAAETRRLSEAMRKLAADNERIKSRLAAVEQSMDDMTGSISRQVEAAKAAAAQTALNTGPTVEATAAAAASEAAPAPLPVAAPPFADTAAQGQAQGQAYGVDIGSALTLPALRARWLSIRAAHPHLLEGLHAVVNVKELGRSSRVELRLVAGPFDQPDAAAKLCASLTALGLYCQPTVFEGQHLALK